MEKQEYTNKELTIHRKTRELYNLQHRIKRYWKRLITESIKVAKQKGIESQIADLDNLEDSVFSPQGSEIIPIYQEGEGINTDIFLKLAQPKFPTLYRRYHKQREKYFKGLDELKKLVHEE